MDDSLDDFFAKRDKTKKKSKSSKSKFVAADLLPPTPTDSTTVDDNADQLAEVKIEEDRPEPVGKEKKKSKKKKDKDGTDDKNEDDEWHAVEEEKDYSGLRIAAKNIAKQAEEDAADGAAADYDENGQLRPKSSDAGGVWSKPNATDEDDEDKDDDDNKPSNSSPPPSPAPVIAEIPNVVDSKYVPPARRFGSRSTDSDLKPMNMKRVGRKKQAPNITSQEDFPTLGAAPPPIDYDVTTFERVRGGASMQQGQSRSSSGSQRVETANMFNALRR